MGTLSRAGRRVSPADLSLVFEKASMDTLGTFDSIGALSSIVAGVVEGAAFCRKLRVP